VSVRHFYRFSYYGSPTIRDEEPHLLLHQLRDADAALELAHILYQRDYEYGGLLLNYPRESKEESRVVDDSFLTPDDLILITGRPPLDDEEIRPRRGIIGRSHTTLEDRIFSTLRRYFHSCARSEITLSRELTNRLPRDARRYRDVEFRLYLDRADIGRLGGRKARDIDSRATMAYLVFTQTTWPGGPGLLCAFGMGGQETLLWGYFLRTKFSHLVCRSEFAMAEIVEKHFEQPKDDLSFADDWDVRILVDIPIK
jgi:hypothetical protein